MALTYHVISADDHVLEPPDLWTQRLSRDRWGDRIPHIAKQPDGAERWVIDGKVVEGRRLADVGALREERFKDAQAWSEVPQEAYDPRARLQAMDRDRVDVQVLSPTASGTGGELFASLIQDPELELACDQAYNDWLLDTWGKASPRFVPQCLLPMASVEAATQELQRCVKAGHRGAVMPQFPWRIRQGAPHIQDPKWDTLWAAAQEAQVPICWHSGSEPQLMLEVFPGFQPPLYKAFDTVRRPISSAIALATFLLGGVPERFPNLKVVFSASGIDWVTFQIENSDHEWTNSMLHKENIPMPSEVFRRQCYVTTWFDKAGLNQRSHLGVDSILWQSEFPMETSTWPRSAEHIERNFADVPKADRDKILYGNAAKLYRIEV